MKSIVVKITALCLTLVFCIFAVACGQGKETETTNSAPETEAPDLTGEEGDVYIRMDFMAEDLAKYVTLGEYKGLEISVPRHTVTDEEIEAEIQNIVESLAELTEYDEPVKDRLTEAGDVLNINFVGTMNGEVFEGGSADDASINLMQNSGYIEWFEDDLYGVMPGTTVTSTGFFPENYYEDLAGKEVTFAITVNYISGHYDIPAFDDELVKANSDFESAEAYREFVRRSMQEENDASYEENKIQLMWEKIMENATVTELPDDQVMYYYTSERSAIEQYGAQYGMSYEEVLPQIGATDEDIMEYAKSRVKDDLVFYSVVKAEGLEITDDDYAAGLAKYAADFSTTETEFEAQYGKDYISEVLLWDKMIAHIGELTTFVE